MELLLDYHEYTLCLPKCSFDIQSAKNERICVNIQSSTSPRIPHTSIVIWNTCEFHQIISYTNPTRYKFHSKNFADNSRFVESWWHRQMETFSALLPNVSAVKGVA